MTSSWALEWSRSMADWARSGSAIWASISSGSGTCSLGWMWAGSWAFVGFSGIRDVQGVAREC